MTPELKEIATALDKADRVLIAAHHKPDGDAVGSTLGLKALLNADGRHADVCFADGIPAKFMPLAEGLWLPEVPPDAATRYAALVMLDCAVPARLCPSVAALLPAMPVLCLDHHPGDHAVRGLTAVDTTAAATCEIVVEVARYLNWSFSPEAASWLLLGLMTDTGSFRFQNTTARTLENAAFLRECGAKWEETVNAAFFSKSRSQMEFEAEMLRCRLRFECGGNYLYAVLPEEMFRRHLFDIRDGETVIDLLREIDKVKIAALIYPHGGKTRLSLRSKDAAFPVAPLAQFFGGGGHAMAAGATVDDPDLDRAAECLLAQVKKTLGGGGNTGK